jgi:ketosteroid isomerase-like protein
VVGPAAVWQGGVVSDENVAIVRDSLEYFAATDRFRRILAPDFVWDMGTYAGWPDKPLFHGTEGLREFLALWRQPYDDWSMRLLELHDCGDDRVLALLEQSGRPHGSDALVRLQHGLFHHLRDGRIRRIQAYASYDEALEAAGLSA